MARELALFSGVDLPQHARLPLPILPVFRQPLRNQALNDIALIPEYYPCWISGVGKTCHRCLKLGAARKPCKRAYPEAI